MKTHNIRILGIRHELFDGALFGVVLCIYLAGTPPRYSYIDLFINDYMYVVL